MSEERVEGQEVKQPDAPKLQKIEIEGEVYDLPEGFVAKMHARDQKVIAEFQKLSEELENSRQTKPKVDESDDIDWGALFDESPKKALALLKKQIKEEAVEEVRGQASVQKAQEAFFTDFYRENDNFHPQVHGELVEMVLQKNMSVLGPMTPKQAMKRLAEMVTEKLEKMSGVRKAKKEEEAVPSWLESSGLTAFTPSGKQKRGQEADEPLSLADAIAERREKRRVRG